MSAGSLKTGPAGALWPAIPMTSHHEVGLPAKALASGRTGTGTGTGRRTRVRYSRRELLPCRCSLRATRSVCLLRSSHATRTRFGPGQRNSGAVRSRDVLYGSIARRAAGALVGSSDADRMAPGRCSQSHRDRKSVALPTRHCLLDAIRPMGCVAWPSVERNQIHRDLF
jgi:hypothetical protein